MEEFVSFGTRLFHPAKNVSVLVRFGLSEWKIFQAMRRTSARFILPIDLYQRDLYVSLGENDERFAQGIRRYKDEAFVAGAVKHMAVAARSGCARFGLNDGFFILRTGVFPQTSLDYATIQHEIFHAVEAMMKAVGMPHSVKYSSEAYAYLTQYITLMLYERLW